MTSYAVCAEARARDGRAASVWAIAPSAARALALIEAYREEADFIADEITQRGPIEMDHVQAEKEGFLLREGFSGLICLVKRPAQSTRFDQAWRLEAVRQLA